MSKSELLKIIPFLLLALLFAGCCTPPAQPPQTMAAGLIGYVTKCKFIPYLQKNGVKNAKCALGKIRLQNSQYRFGEAIHAMSEDLFETMVWDSGQQVAAKEAINAILRSSGISDTSRLWDPPVLKQFMEKIQQTGGRSVLDYLLLVNITGTQPSLQAQAKIVCTTPGPDWGQQIPVRVEINWQTIYCGLEGEHTGTEWQMEIENEMGCEGSVSGESPAPGGGGGASSGGGAVKPTETVIPEPQAPQGQDLMDDLKNNFLPQLLGMEGTLAIFPPLWENDEGTWISKGLSEDITKGLSGMLRHHNKNVYYGSKLVSALESNANRGFCHFCRPEDATALGFRMFEVRGVIGGEIDLVKPTAFQTKVGIKLWCLDSFGDEKASFEYTYSPMAGVNGQHIIRRFEFAAKRGVCNMAKPFTIDYDREIAWAVDDMIGSMITEGLLKEDAHMAPHLSGYLKVSQKGLTLSQDRLIAVVGAAEFTSGGKQELNPSPKLVTWMTKRLGLLDLRFSTLLDSEIAGFVRKHVNLFQESPELIDQVELQKLVGAGKPVPDTMALVKIRPPLVKGKGQTLSICWRDIKSGNTIAWYEYPLPQFQVPPPQLGSPTIFNTTIQGSNYVFIIDISGSMNASLPGSTISRLEYAKTELIRLIDSLSPANSFQILAFSDSVIPMQANGLAQASPEIKSMAKQFVAGLKPQGGTSTRKALQLALQTPGVQTICLLSDGQPNAGPNAVLQAVKQATSPGIIINTFAFEGANKQFMQQLAADNGGVFTNI